MKSKKGELIETERMVFARVWGGGGRNWINVGQRVQTCSSKMNKFLRFNTYYTLPSYYKTRSHMFSP